MRQVTESAFAAYRDATALVFGASGFIGGWVARALAENGARTFGVVRHEAVGEPRGARTVGRIETVVADLTVPGAAADAILNVHPDVVFNLAGYGVDRSERDRRAMSTLNDRLVFELCECLARIPAGAWPGLRLVHVGSALEYGPVRGRLDESQAAIPTTDYGRTKLAGTRHVEHFGRSAGLPAVVARLFNVYGAGEHADRLLPSIQRAASSGERVRLTSGLQQRDFTYVEDVARGLLRLALAPARPGEVVHLATGHLTTVRDFAVTAAEVLGLAPDGLEFGALPIWPDEVVHDGVAVERLRELTGWLPATPLADGIRRSAELAYVG